MRKQAKLLLIMLRLTMGCAYQKLADSSGSTSAIGGAEETS